MRNPSLTIIKQASNGCKPKMVLADDMGLGILLGLSAAFR